MSFPKKRQGDVYHIPSGLALAHIPLPCMSAVHAAAHNVARADSSHSKCCRWLHSLPESSACDCAVEARPRVQDGFGHGVGRRRTLPRRAEGTFGFSSGEGKAGQSRGGEERERERGGDFRAVALVGCARCRPEPELSPKASSSPEFSRLLSRPFSPQRACRSCWQPKTSTASRGLLDSLPTVAGGRRLSRVGPHQTASGSQGLCHRSAQPLQSSVPAADIDHGPWPPKDLCESPGPESVGVQA